MEILAAIEEIRLSCRFNAAQQERYDEVLQWADQSRAEEMVLILHEQVVRKFRSIGGYFHHSDDRQSVTADLHGISARVDLGRYSLESYFIAITEWHKKARENHGK